MRLSEIDPFLYSGIALCLLMAVVSSLRSKTRGVSAFIMGGAFLVLGLALFLVHLQASQGLILGVFAILILLLGADFAARSAHRSQGGGS